MKKMFKRALQGFPMGIAIGQCISILFSSIYGGGNFVPLAPEFQMSMPNEMTGVVVQTVLCGLLGSVFSMASLIWMKEEYSLLKQTVLYFTVLAGAMLPIAYCLYWMKHSLMGFLSYFLCFIVIFVAFWLGTYLYIKSSIKKLNQNL